MNVVNLSHLEDDKKKELEDLEIIIEKRDIPEISQEERTNLGKRIYELVEKMKSKSPQMEQIREHTNEMIKDLILEGADVNYQEQEKGRTPLIICARRGLLSTFKLLVNNGADINKGTYYLTTPVMDSARYNHPDILKILILLGADINAQCLDGETALMIAKRHNSISCFNMLKEAGANFKTMNLRNEMVVDILSTTQQTSVDYSGISPFPSQEEVTKTSIVDCEKEALSEAQKELSSVCYNFLESGLIKDDKETSNKENDSKKRSGPKVRVLNL